MVKNVIIIGGGVAGLSAAASLVSRGFRVQLFEARPYLGGRIYSFNDPSTGDSVDNGQHLFAGFYYETFKFLSLIGSAEHIARQRRLNIDFIDKSRNFSKVKAVRYLPSPLHIVAGLFRYSRFPKMDLVRMVMKARCLKKKLGPISADDFLTMMGQSESAKNVFFRPLVLATLNADLHEVSARLFQAMLKEIFSVPAAHSVLAYATTGFSELIAEPAKGFIEENGGEIFCSAPIGSIKVKGGMIAGVIDRDKNVHVADFYISALPPDDLARVFPGCMGNLKRWAYSPIVSVNLWFDRPISGKLMVGILDGNFHWFFDKASIVKDPDKHRYVTLLASSAYDKIALSKDNTVEMALTDMKNYFSEYESAKLLHSQVIKERKATVLIAPGMNDKRPGVKTAWENFFIAGDWVDTGLPATVESAVKSGFMAAELVSECS